MNSKLLSETTDSRTYRLERWRIYWVEDKKNIHYVSTWSRRDYRNWKRNRRTQ